MKKRRGGLIINLFLVLVMISLYALTSAKDAVQTMAALYAGPIYRGSATDALALEFAASWDAAALGDILDTLREANVCATFAVSGEYARDHADMVRRIAQEGHELATMGDIPAFDGSVSAVAADIQRSIESIEQAADVVPALYFSGERGIRASSRAARETGLSHVLCTLNLRCAAGSAADILARGLNEPIFGSIILMQPTRACADALPGLIDGLSKKGLRVLTVSEVIDPG